LFLQKYLPNALRINHIQLISKGGTNDEENLWLLCETYNRAKSDKTEAFDAETQTTIPLFNRSLCVIKFFDISQLVI